MNEEQAQDIDNSMSQIYDSQNISFSDDSIDDSDEYPEVNSNEDDKNS